MCVDNTLLLLLYNCRVQKFGSAPHYGSNGETIRHGNETVLGEKVAASNARVSITNTPINVLARPVVHNNTVYFLAYRDPNQT